MNSRAVFKCPIQSENSHCETFTSTEKYSPQAFPPPQAYLILIQC